MRKIPNEELGRPTPGEFRRRAKFPVTVVLDNIRSRNNIGSVFRTADAFCIERIRLCGICAVPPDKEIHKTALGAEETVEWDYFPRTVDAVRSLREADCRVLAVEQVEGACSLDRFEPEEGVRYALVLGNEVEGVQQEAVDLCDGALEIPQLGTKHSLNVSVSAGIVLWHFFRAYLR